MVILRRINAVLAIIAVCTTLLFVGCLIYTKVANMDNSSIIKELEGV